MVSGSSAIMAERLISAESFSYPYYIVENPVGADSMFIFHDANDASFKTLTGQYATWTELRTKKKIEGTNMFQSVQDGYCYSVEIDGKETTFVFIEYKNHRLNTAQPDITLDCHQTTIDLGNVAAIPYYTDSLNVATGEYDVQEFLKPSFYVTYDNQRWETDKWVTKTICDTLQSNDKGVFILDSILCDTKFTFMEPAISLKIYDQTDSIGTEEYEAVAVAHHQQYFIAKRGKTLENEKEGPYEDKTIAHSAPLDILFESHPSAKADYYSWKIAKGKDTITSRNDKDMRYTFDEASESGPITYSVNLKVLNSDHPECFATAQDTITINSSFILVPNVFTPNGDGDNDEFRVVYRSICDFHCWVYNRWQHLVYSWDDPTKGWDGTYNGRQEPASAFIYIIDATGCDGQRFKLKGTVNLLRDYKN